MRLRIDQFYESQELKAPVKFVGYTTDGCYLFNRYHKHVDHQMKWKWTDRQKLEPSKDTNRILANLKPIPPPQ